MYLLHDFWLRSHDLLIGTGHMFPFLCASSPLHPGYSASLTGFCASLTPSDSSATLLSGKFLSLSLGKSRASGWIPSGLSAHKPCFFSGTAPSASHEMGGTAHWHSCCNNFASIGSNFLELISWCYSLLHIFPS